MSCAAKQNAKTSARISRITPPREFPPNGNISVYVHRSWRRDFLGRHSRLKSQVEEADHHFIPALLAPNDGLGWIRVFRIVGRVVEVGGALNFGTLRQINGIGKVVPELPMPVIGRDAQNGLGFAVWKCQAIFKRLASRVHVRVQTDQLYGLLYLKRGIDFVVRVARRNLECSVRSREGQDTVL